MWDKDNIRYSVQANPVTLDKLLRENQLVIRKNDAWDQLTNLEALKNQSVVVGQVYTEKVKKGKPAKQKIRDIAIAEIKDVQWNSGGVAISVKLHATTKPNPTELDAQIVLVPPVEGIDWMKRVSLPNRAHFNVVFEVKSLTCLVFEIGRKADRLFNIWLKEQAPSDAAVEPAFEALGKLLQGLSVPKQ
jgi:hypothetical protein